MGSYETPKGASGGRRGRSVSANDAYDAEWGACRFCGVAVLSGAVKCGICGAERPLSAAEAAHAPPRVRRRLRLTGSLRTIIVVTVVLGLAYTLISAVLSGPPTLPNDPLSTSGTYTIGPGNYTVLSGDITAGDFVIGNYTSVAPVGTNIGVAVYNLTEWSAFHNGRTPTPLWSVNPTAHARIVYSPIVTDTYFFVFTNPYPVSSHLAIGVYITTTYQSNVANEGFA